MLAISNEAHKDLLAFEALFGCKTTVLEELSVLDRFPGTGKPGTLPSTRHLEAQGRSFVAVYGHACDTTILYRFLPRLI